jgi:hypothetical protein
VSNLYRIEVNVVATAYIRADSPDEAMAKAERELTGFGFEVVDEGRDGFVTGVDYDEVPEISLSPAMTIVSVDKESAVDCVSPLGQGVKP